MRHQNLSGESRKWLRLYRSSKLIPGTITNGKTAQKTMDSRFYKDHRQLLFIGKPGLARFQAARILVVGAGCLGCPVIGACATSGIWPLAMPGGDCAAQQPVAR